MQEQEHDSNFVTGLKIKTSAYITELIILNEIEWKMKKGILASKPMCPFWRKESQTTPELKKLAEQFKLELTYVKNLLKVFRPVVLIKYIKDRGIITIRYLTLDKQKAMVYNLYLEQVEYEKQKAANESKKVDTETLVFTVDHRKPKIKKGII